MITRLSIITLTALGIFILTSSGLDALAKPNRPQTKSPTKTQPAVTPRQKAGTIKNIRKVRNQLYGAQKLASQRHANAATTLRRARDTERALKDNHAAAMTSALRRVPSVRPEGMSRQEYAMRDRGVRDAVKALQTATANRANAEGFANSTRRELREARRQVKAANRTLSLAKKDNWVAAYKTAHRVIPKRPKTRPRKITFNAKTLGPTPKGSAPTRGILKTSPRK